MIHRHHKIEYVKTNEACFKRLVSVLRQVPDDERDTFVFAMMEEIIDRKSPAEGTLQAYYMLHDALKSVRKEEAKRFLACDPPSEASYILYKRCGVTMFDSARFDE